MYPTLYAAYGLMLSLYTRNGRYARSVLPLLVGEPTDGKERELARKALNKPQYQWRVNRETITWLYDQAEKRQVAVADLLEDAVKLLRKAFENTSGKVDEKL